MLLLLSNGMARNRHPRLRYSGYIFSSFPGRGALVQGWFGMEASVWSMNYERLTIGRHAMPKVRCVLLVAFVWAMADLSIAKPVRSDEKPQPFHGRTDYGKARKEAEQTRRLMVINFTRDHPATERMEREFRNETVTEFLKQHAIPVKILYDSDGLKEKFEIKLYPTTVLVTHDGRVLRTLVGYREAETLLEEFGKAVEANGAAKK